ncbi:hypothetical protein JTB14_009323 [Gonioctena quinquepunctata]|nr:hypothetical protein JTB14_009323 [Gonioctena quinquepunctata]
MEGKVEVNRLEKEELSYELDIRGITGLTTVDSMRKSLRNLLKLEKAGTSLTFPSYPFTFDEDSVYIERKISEIEILVTDFSDSETSSSFSKIYSKLLHVFERTERSVSTKDEEHSKRSTFLIKLLELKLNLLSKTRKFKRDSRNSQIPLQLSMIGQAGHSSSRASSLSLVEVHTVAELLQLCRQIEARKISIDSYSPPPKNRANLMEPDLAGRLLGAYGYSPRSSFEEWKFTRVNGTFADINAVEALHSRELLTSDQVEILDELVNDCFVRMGNSLGCTKIVEHKIELLDNEGTHFTVVTDHWSLCWLNNLKDPTGRLGRWSLKLQQYSFDLVQRKGKENVVPDMLSRTVPIIDALDIAVNVDLGKSDKWYDRMLYDVDSNPLRFPTWRISDSKLYKYVQFKKIPGLDFHDDWKLVISKNKRKDILLKCHDDPQAGHPGVFKTFKRVSEHFYWPKMKADISSHVKRCKVCCENKPEQRKPAGLLTPHRVVDRPFQLVCCNLIGPLPRSNRGFKFILVIVDNFSKFSLVIPLRNSTAKLVCTAVEDHLFLMFGPPKFLLSDNGSQFRSKEFRNLLANYAVKQIFTANYHKQANPTERVNKTLETMIRCYVSENHKEWDKMLSKVACSIRTQVHESMRRTPYFVVFGREFPMNLEIGVPDSSGDFTVDQEILARDRSVPLQQLYEEVKGKLLKAAERNKRYYDLRHRDVKYEVGDEVYRKNFVHSDAAKFYSSKLANKFVGPFIVFKRVSPWVYELKDPDGRFRGSWHAKDLKPCPK